MKRLITICSLLLSLTVPLFADSGEKEKERVKESGDVMKEILAAPDKGIPGSDACWMAPSASSFFPR